MLYNIFFKDINKLIKIAPANQESYELSCMKYEIENNDENEISFY